MGSAWCVWLRIDSGGGAEWGLQSAMITALAGWQSLWWNTFSALCEPQIRTSQAVIDKIEDFRACHGENRISNEASKINNK